MFPALPAELDRPSAQRANEVSADLDEANIIPEGVTRQRKKTSRKEAHAAALENTAKGGINAFHNAFAACFSASSFNISSDQLDFTSFSTSVGPSDTNVPSEQRIH